MTERRLSKLEQELWSEIWGPFIGSAWDTLPERAQQLLDAHDGPIYEPLGEGLEGLPGVAALIDWALSPNYLAARTPADLEPPREPPTLWPALERRLPGPDGLQAGRLLFLLAQGRARRSL
ncbi:hypothetical protein Mterra_00102 [Calidithermus terrae]|uniref:Uncharacterized protein n=1 Tax=Calidithermus terrae TaxID=1408545 RepID=A0A399F3W2_9DEIN|nr:hypothetical protein [Calidithermus terrae]RIH90878.1 hypothetical protein Mterra_00102 [Calidithermus terrae]